MGEHRWRKNYFNFIAEQRERGSKHVCSLSFRPFVPLFCAKDFLEVCVRTAHGCHWIKYKMSVITGYCRSTLVTSLGKILYFSLVFKGIKILKKVFVLFSLTYWQCDGDIVMMSWRHNYVKQKWFANAYIWRAPALTDCPCVLTANHQAVKTYSNQWPCDLITMYTTLWFDSELAIFVAKNRIKLKMWYTFITIFTLWKWNG